MFGLPPEGWTVGSTYTTLKGKEMKMEVRHYKDSEDSDTHTALHIGDYSIGEDDENSRDFANRTFWMNGPKGDKVSFGDKRCRGANWNEAFRWKEGSEKELREFLKTLAQSEEVTVEELIAVLPSQFYWFLRFPSDVLFARDFLRSLPPAHWRMAVQVLDDLQAQEGQEIDLVTYTAAITA
eukprot:symbB.v1.2.002343.t1/scaffold121.1/size317807/7